MSAFRLSVCLLFVLTLAASSAAPLYAQSSGVTGRVLDAGTSTPLPGVHVVAYGEDAEHGVSTDAEGRFAIADLPAGIYRVEASMVGFEKTTRQVTLRPGAAERLTIELREVAVGLDEIVVSATRMATPVAAIPGAVSVIRSEEIERQAAVSQGLGEILGQTVPGLAVGTQSMSNYGQTLRGRSVVVLIDGVPQSTLRNVSRDFTTIDPAMIDRIEVLRGATSIYGDGATGGVINIITKRPPVGDASYRTKVTMSSSLTAPGSGVGSTLLQTVMGRQGPLRYTVSGSLAQTGGFYDAEGDRIPPDPHGQGGLSDATSWDVLAKVGLDLPGRRVQLSVNHFDSDQETEYTPDPSVDDFPAGEQKARVTKGLEQDIPQGTRNTVVSLDYDEAQLAGSRLHAQAYYRNYMTIFRPFDRRRRNEHVSQSFIDSEKWGGRLEVETPLLRALEGTLLWGADYTFEDTSQPVYVMDPDLYDASGGLEFRRIGERIWVPPLRPRSLGLFAQAAFRPFDPLLVRGGMRYERVRMHVDDFTTLAGNAVLGGDLAYDPVLFNVGATLDVTQELNFYANYAQGFSLADVGRILRAAKPGFDVGGNSLPAPTVDHYEVGVRGDWAPLALSFSTFTSRSELGTRMRQDASGALVIDPAPERIYGFETTVDVRPTSAWRTGGSFSWNEGEYEDAKHDRWRPLDGYRIQPYKLTGYVEHDTRPGWTNRLQVLHSGSRDRAFDERLDPSKPAGYGEYPIDAYTVVELNSSLDLWLGTLEVGVENLLNAQYFDVISQLDIVDGNLYYSAARGASLSLGYSITY